ncbi:CsgG/HfaB family protein [Kiritimatiellaeota bacterium B1221]|nr:CsgG/HfaB family protein [Kiritimatiellaeota bacterium B1221]
MKKVNYVSRALLLGTALLASTPSHAILDKLIGSGGTETKEANNKSDKEHKGVKHAIGVRDFTNDAGWSGQWDLGNNLGVMLESALYDSGKFVVVSRDKIDTVIQEQDLAASGRTTKSNVAQTGKLRSAKYIATGSITTVDSGTKGSSGGIGFKGIRIGGGGSKSTITAIITLIDTTTGEIIAKERVTGESGARKLNIGYSGNGINTDLGGFAKEPVGEAAQDVISKAVDLLVEEMKDQKLDGSVVAISGSKIIINRGEQYGISSGEMFVVQTKGEVLTDPDSGEILDRMEGETICTLKVDSVKEKIAYCSLVDGEMPDRGATVIMK